MFPISDVIPSRTTPVVTIALIAVNAAVFLYQAVLSDLALELFVARYALIPAWFSWTALFTSQFLHAGWLHAIGNMLYLWIFGDNVEDRLGHFKYLVFYLLCGWIASFAHIWASPASRVPSIGASGAIAGVLGAYLVLFPHARVHALLPLGILTQMVHIPAVFFLGFWFLQQLAFGYFDLTNPVGGGGGVAYFAHIGGFVFGALMIKLFARRTAAGGPPRPVY